jgi:predicted secreted protein
VEEFKKKQAAWQEKVEELSKVIASQKADQKERQKASEEFSKHYQKRSEFVQEDRTGYVWVYLQK